MISNLVLHQPLFQSVLVPLQLLPQLLLPGQLAPLYLPPVLLLLGLRLHLLHVHGVGLASAHEEVMIADAQVQDELVHAQFARVEGEVGRALLHRLDDKLLVLEGDVSDLGPGEHDLGLELVVALVDGQSLVGHAQPEVALLLVEDLEVVDAVHVQVLGDLEVLHLGLVSRHATVVGVPDLKKIWALVKISFLREANRLFSRHLDPVLPHLPGHLVLVYDPLREQVLVGQQPRLVGGLVVVAVLGLDGVGRQQHRSLGRAVHVHVQDGLLHLQKKNKFQSHNLRQKKKRKRKGVWTF